MTEEDLLASQYLLRVAADVFDGGFDVRVRRFSHSLPCGPCRDPGPFDSVGRRWHWCYAVTVNDRYSFYGRLDDVVGQMVGHGRETAPRNASGKR